jgi:hypothetical protein
MSQRGPVPNMNALRWFGLCHRALRFPATNFRASKRADDVELATEPDRPANAAQDAIHFLKIPVAVEIKHRQPRRLRAQFLVGHFDFPQPRRAKTKYDTVVDPTQSDSTASDKNKSYRIVACSNVERHAHQTAVALS